MLSRRSFLTITVAAPLTAAPARQKIPVGLELFSVRKELAQDLMGTVRAVAKMGYQGVEFFSPYAEWTPAYAKDVRKLLDDLGIRCFSTHNGAKQFAPENLAQTSELNKILGSRYAVMASAGRVQDLDGWKAVADRLNQAAERWKSDDLRTGFHNHQLEFKPIDGKRPMEVLAANTSKDVMLQLDVGTCVEAGVDPVAWIEKNPGRIRSLHLKDWSAEQGKGYEVLFGEGQVPWAKVLDAAEKKGGVEYYLIEQEGSPKTPFETAKECLTSFRKLRPA